MIKYFCDRCGKEITKAKGNLIEIRDMERHKYFEKLAEGHLCMKCLTSYASLFHDWIKEKKSS